MHSTWFSSTFVTYWKFYKITEDGGGEGDLISKEEAILQNNWILSPHVLPLYFNIKHIKGPYFPSFIKFHCVLHDSVVLLLAFENFLKLKRGNLISWGEPIVQNCWIIWSHFLYFNIHHWKDSNSSSLIRF